MADSLGWAWKEAQREAMTGGARIRATMTELTLAAAAPVAAIAAIGVTTKEVIETFAEWSSEIHGAVDQLGTLSAATGLSLDTLNGLRVMARSVNKELDEIVPKDLAKRIEETSRGTGEGLVYFQEYGIEVRDAAGELRKADDVFRDTIRVLSEMTNATERAAVAEKLLGMEGRNLFSALSSVDDLDRFVELARDFGLDVGEEAVARTNEWYLATSSLTTAFEGLKSSVVTEFGPQVVPVLQDAAVATVYLASLIREIDFDVISFAEHWAGFTSWGLPVELRAGAKAAMLLADNIDITSGALGRAAEAARQFREEYFAATQVDDEGLFRQQGPALPGTPGADALAKSRAEQAKQAKANAAKAAAERAKENADNLRDVEAMQREIEAALAHTNQVELDHLRWLGDYREEQHQKELDRIREQMDLHRIATETRAEQLEFLDELATEFWNSTLGAIESIESAKQSTAQAEIDRFKRIGEGRIAEEQRVADEAVRQALRSGRITEEEADRVTRANERNAQKLTAQLIQQAEAREADEKSRAIKSFYRIQTLQISQATVDAARAAISMIPGFAFLGPGAPIAAATAAAGALAIQIAAISAQPPPAFPTGGVQRPSDGARAGHYLGYLDPGEGVLSRRAMSDPAVARMLERANRGERMQGRGGRESVEVVVRLDRSARRLRVEQSSRSPGKRPRRER